MPLGLGVDFEHIYHTPAYRALDDSPRIPIDIEAITTRLLRLFDRHDARTTFFIVSDLAEKYPDLIKRIADQGHEIASHSVTHPSLPSLTTGDKRTEIFDSKEILEELSRSTVQGFRAPTFQVDDEVYTLLAEAGYNYSSSTVPSLPIPNFYSTEYMFTDPTNIITEAGTLVERPVAVNPWVRLPITGAWTRLFGRTYTLSSVCRLLNHTGSVLTYVHPWEFTSLWDTPLPFRNRVRTGDWLFETYERLLALDAKCVPVRDVVDERSHAEYTIAQP